MARNQNTADDSSPKSARTMARTAVPEGATRVARWAFHNAKGAVTGAQTTMDATPSRSARLASRRATISWDGAIAGARGASYGFGTTTSYHDRRELGEAALMTRPLRESFGHVHCAPMHTHGPLAPKAPHARQRSEQGHPAAVADATVPAVRGVAEGCARVASRAAAVRPRVGTCALGLGRARGEGGSARCKPRFDPTPKTARTGK